ncbi:hypothetical protein SAMN06265173_101414 [Thalassovita litoralis]|uniref:Response regulatory domain-containing protein n=1 Tax=Thalassovita litoralis TaxID=1010611 RepID=A0A521AWT3_9RHOB|nr:response regulator [Thalassovita litoralis]SMO39296.1 hypothetical protein SAMN06265173_101414 [Thalassovita litoralis]
MTAPESYIAEDSSPSAIRNVLIVDDSRLQRRILAASLQRWGFAVTEADSQPNKRWIIVWLHRPIWC